MGAYEKPFTRTQSLFVDGTEVSASAAELNTLDITAAGTVEASKAVVVDANKDIGDFRNVTVTNLDAGASGTAGSVDIFPSTESKGKLTISCANQTGDTAFTLQPAEHGQATTLVIPDGGAATAYAVQSTAALLLTEVDVLDGATAGTQLANKAVIADANVNTGVSKVTELHIGATGSETQVTATAAELNNAADVSARVQEITSSGAQAVTSGVQSLELNNDSAAIAATIASSVNHQGLFIVKATSEPAVANDHTLTLTSGTFNGSNNVATFADINDALVVYFDSAGNGTILENVGTVALS